jgi:hypothetical protein
MIGAMLFATFLGIPFAVGFGLAIRHGVLLISSPTDLHR